MRVGILEKLPILHTKSAIFAFLLPLLICKLADDDVTSGRGKKVCRGQYGEFPIFRIFGLKLLSTFSRLDNKRGGIL